MNTSSAENRDFLTKEILYSLGHRCVPNGVGDYVFLCPTLGEKPGFIPFMLRDQLRGKCVCGVEIMLERNGTTV
jgi:hypothetical protein